MKSPITATDYSSSKAAASAPFVRRGFRVTDTTTTTPSTAAAPYNGHEPFGVVALLPLAVQATFRRKLIAIIALQLGAVALVVALLEALEPSWLDDLVDNTTPAVLLGVAVLALLALLNWNRDKFPVNWVVLALLTCALAVGSAAADTALDSHVVVANYGFSWVFVVGLVLTAGWTQPAHSRHNCCDGRGMTFGWSPPLAASSLSMPDGGPASDVVGGRHVLVSPFVSGTLSFIVASGVLAVVDAVVNDIGISRDAILVSFFVQLAVSTWFLFQLDSSQHRLTPDAYMSGVVYLYADVLVVVSVLALALALAASCAGGNAPSALDGAALLAPFYPPLGTNTTAALTSQGDTEEQV